MIELRRLRYVIAVAEEGHLTRAAERIGIQQPPLSRQIRELEDELGLALFHRLPRGMEITEAGRAFVEEARTILALAERLPETARRAARGELGRIVIGYTSSAAFNPFVTGVLRDFRRARPGVLMALEEDATSGLLSALAEGRLDAAFIRTPGGDAPGLMLEPLLEEPMLAVLPVEHALAASGSGLRLADLAGDTFILYRRPNGPGLYDAIIAACHAAGFSPQVGQEAPRMPSTLSLVAAGLGVSIVPASMRRMNVEGVAYLSLEGSPALTAPLLLATRAEARSPVVDVLRQAVNRAAANA
jgi:DNA-binding transcriptional LysR family regulator